MPTAEATVAGPNHDERCRLDLAEGVRSFNYRRIVRSLVADYPARVAASRAAGVNDPMTKEEAGRLYRDDPAYLLACGLQRSMQQLAWSTAVDSVNRRTSLQVGSEGGSPVWPDEAVGPSGPRLELDPDLPLPGWYTAAASTGGDDIHLVPGGYWGHDRVGEVYDLGGAAYRLAGRKGYDARPGALDAFVASVAEPGCASAVDLGCSFGALTRALRRRLPGATVTGLDLSAPALRHAYRMARAQDEEIIYAQRDVTATGMADDSVDLIVAFLLMHEVPDDVRPAIVAESLRILRPGGRLAVLDIPPYAVLEPVQAFFESFDGRGNGEHHWEAFLSSDFTGLLTDTGFIDVVDGPLDFDEPQ
jgi:SAM-dependent methyltransferase